MGLNILIIDDSATARKTIKKSLGMAGFETERVLEAAEGREALALIQSEELDLILLDLHMEGMDGEDVVDAVQGDSATRSIPIIMISSDHSQHRIDTLRAKGIHAFISKPFHPELLQRIIKQVLGDRVR